MFVVKVTAFFRQPKIDQYRDTRNIWCIWDLLAYMLTCTNVLNNGTSVPYIKHGVDMPEG